MGKVFFILLIVAMEFIELLNSNDNDSEHQYLSYARDIALSLLHFLLTSALGDEF